MNNRQIATLNANKTSSATQTAAVECFLHNYN